MTKIEDRELETWREQWRSVAEPLPEVQSKLQRRIKRQSLFFVISNLAAAIALVGTLVFAAWAVRQEPSRLRIGWAIGISVLVFVAAGYRLWMQRGTWRPESQSTRAFVELWHRRVVARIRLIRVAFYLIPAWLVFCAVLAAVNWAALAPDVRAHPMDWVEALGIDVLVLPVLFWWLFWYRRRKRAELQEVERILDEMKDSQ